MMPEIEKKNISIKELCPVCPFAEPKFLEYLTDCRRYCVQNISRRISIAGGDLSQSYELTAVKKGSPVADPRRVYGEATYLVTDGPWAGLLAADLGNEKQFAKLLSPDLWNLDPLKIDRAITAGNQAIYLRPIINYPPSEIYVNAKNFFPSSIYDLLRNRNRQDLIDATENLEPLWLSKILVFLLELNNVKVNRSRFIQNSVPLNNPDTSD
jgi:hypothetical protein